MNSVLGAWHNAGVTSVDGAKKYGTAKPSAASQSSNIVTKTYTSEQLNAMFDNLNSEDL